MKRLALTLALSFALAGCYHAPDPSTAPAPAAKGKPENGAWGVDLSGMDTSVKPGDDFFRYMNGRWLDRTEIPADKLETGGLTALQDKSLAETKKILEDAAADKNAPAGSEMRKIGDWYASYMDEAAIEAAGYAPIQPELDAIDAITNNQQLVDQIAKNHLALGARPINVGTDVSRNSRDKVDVTLEIAGLTLGARDIYLEAAYAPVRKLQLAHVANLLRIGGFDDAEARAKHVQDLEIAIAKITWPAAELRDDNKRNNVVTIAELQRRAPGIDWPKFLADTGVGTPAEVNMVTPSSITGMVELVTKTPVDEWKDYLRYATLAGMSQYLPKAGRDEMFDFLGKKLRGAQEPGPRWIDALLEAGGQGRPLADPLSREYVKRYVSPEARPKARAMVDNLIAAFDARLAKLEWMAPETRAGARDKLSKVTIKVLYPDVYRDIRSLEVKRGDPVGNARRGAAWLRAESLAWLKKYPDRRLFFQPVYLVNAYANTSWNEIVFLAAIVRPPAFDPNADDAVNYGAMGAIIGHEISHLFDDKGRSSDGDGLLRDWWTPQDAERFNRVAKQLQDQVSSYEPIPGKKVNGPLTLGESIADEAGLVVAYDAYQRSLGGKPAPVIDGYTADQRFFLAYAQAWRWKGRDAAVAQMMQTDAHPPSAVRPNTVRNIDVWYSAFDVKPGDKLYLDPKDRVKLW